MKTKIVIQALALLALQQTPATSADSTMCEHYRVTADGHLTCGRVQSVPQVSKDDKAPGSESRNDVDILLEKENRKLDSKLKGICHGC